jgi:hypothetical protein
MQALHGMTQVRREPEGGRPQSAEHLWAQGKPLTHVLRSHVIQNAENLDLYTAKPSQ